MRIFNALTFGQVFATIHQAERRARRSATLPVVLMLLSINIIDPEAVIFVLLSVIGDHKYHARIEHFSGAVTELDR